MNDENSVEMGSTKSGIVKGMVVGDKSYCKSVDQDEITDTNTICPRSNIPKTEHYPTNYWKPSKQ